jgi:hypothetical protein
MQTAVLNLAQQTLLARAPETVLSFRPFVDYLKKRRGESNSTKNRFFNYVIEQYEQHPELLKEMDVNETGKYQEQLQLIYSTLSPIVEDENEHRWALCMPLMPVVFYSTNSYFKLVTDIATGNIRKSIAQKDPEELRRNNLQFIYALILEKCYNLPSFFNLQVVHSLKDKQTGFLRYYNLNLDTRFVEVSTKEALPELSIAALQAGSHDTISILSMLEEKLPLDIFRFEGFVINTVSEVTAQYSIENIKNTILNRSAVDEDNCYSDVIHSLKTLAGTDDIEFGLLPAIKVNNKLIFNDGDCLKSSKLIEVSRKHGIAEMAYMSMAESYFNNPKVIFYREITPEDEARQMFLKLLKQEGIASYALTPVYFNNSIAGVLEIYSTKKSVLDESILARLEPAIPLLSQLLKNSIEEFNDSIEKVIKEKFTSIQPSVQWKFNEVAWHYLRDQHLLKGKNETEPIGFDNVNALYGAIDIRNSTIERNAALHKDLETQFRILLDVLNKLKSQSGFSLIDAKIFTVQKWLEKISSREAFNQEIEVNDFLENELTPFLMQFREGNPAVAPTVEEYFEAIDENTGIAHENRRRLETAMNTVISAVNDYLDMMKQEIQEAYPTYFEKFRTDGVEYDIYIGQSLAPEKPYRDIYLKNLRLLQLTSMSAIAKYTHALLAQLDKPVQTTQLIFIHSHAININFRKDEKRFDVEGAYNIRYHIVKKRIDKVHIKNTDERLTQPNKIALVYFNQKEADEYITYIRYLQGENILRDDLEYLELEELQGVSGLRALRVGVNVE